LIAWYAGLDKFVPSITEMLVRATRKDSKDSKALS
jgi:hypothetical protein